MHSGRTHRDAGGPTKGEVTRLTVLDAAISRSSSDGLGGISLNGLARAVGMSKSGLFAHFESKEDLQLQVIARAREQFIERVVAPGLKAPRGLPRFRSLMELWQKWDDNPTMPGGCVFLAYARELDDRPGPLRDALVRAQLDWVDVLVHAAGIAVEEGHFRQGIDLQQFVYDVHGAIMAYHYYKRLLHEPDAQLRLQTALNHSYAIAASPADSPPNP